MLAHLKQGGLPEGFEENVKRHFALKKKIILKTVSQWIHEVSIA
jgi:hypothetical protein